MPIFNALSLTSGILSFVALISAAFASSIILVYVAVGLGLAAITLGIVGLSTKESGKGLGISGTILGGLGFLISLLVALIVNALQ